MGMRSTAKVTVSLSLLNVAEVNLYSAIDSKEEIKFNQLCGKCHSRIKYQTVCPNCNREIIDKKSELVKGYEISKGNYVTFTDDELEALKKESNKELRIIQFVKAEEIDPIYFESSYFLSADPKGVGVETFSLLYQLIRDSKKVGLAKIVLRQKEHFFAIKAKTVKGRECLVAHSMYYPAQVRDSKEVSNPKYETTKFDPDTLELGNSLITKLTKPFRPDEIVDEYNTQLRDMIVAKSNGVEVVPEAVREVKKVFNLNEMLSASLKQAA